MRGLIVALLVMFCAARPLRTQAQDERPRESKPLDKKVTLKADHERLEDVLNELAKAGYFTFSYQSDILKKDRLVTLTIRESTLREALELILGKAYDYLESDDYVIIRPRDRVSPKAFRGNPDDGPYVKEKALTAGPMVAMKMKEGERMQERKVKEGEPMQEMKMKKRAQMMKRGMPDGPDSLNTLDSLKMVKLRVTVRNIVNDMIADGIVRDKDSFRWFGLDSGQFIVDGKQMADSLRVKYAEKYVKDGYGYYYGPVSIQGRGYFFDKKEIYGTP
jgi:hypothetical protein